MGKDGNLGEGEKSTMPVQRISSNLGKELTYGSYNIVTLNYKYVETPDNQM